MTNLYLCTEHDPDTEENFFKWGITTKPTANKRSRNYVEAHRFAANQHAKAAEAYLCNLIYWVFPEYQYKCGQGRTPWTERVEADFPFDLLLEIWDTVQDAAETSATDKEFSAKLPKLGMFEGIDPIYTLMPMQPFADTTINKWRQHFAKAYYQAPEPKQALEPMWS